MDLGQGIRRALAKITGAHLVDEKSVDELVKELQRALISSDVNVKLVFDLTKRIKERALKEKPLPGLSLREHVVKVVYEELQRLLGKEKFEPGVGKQKILMLGLYGQGKTTTIGKIAKFYSARGLKAGVVAGDVHRPAAFEQLKQLSEQTKSGFYGEKGEKDAARIALDSLKALEKYDVLVFDSAGRSAFDEDLARELKQVSQAFKPDEKYLVVSADLGQVAGKQAQQFHDALGLTGVVITKMDGSGKGGGALTSVAVSGAQVAFIGTGEKMGDLEVFDAQKFVGELVGFPDINTLMNKAREASDEEQVQRALEKGELDYESFLAQMRAMKKMGPLKQIMQMLGVYDLPDELVSQSEEKLKKFEAAVLSMTPKERRKTELMKQKPRQARVAKGAGLTEKEVRELVQNFERANKLVKRLGKDKGFLKKLGKGFPGMAGLKGLKPK